MFVEERHEKILDILKEKGRIRAREIQELFDVGFDTARRDLRLLEEKGLLKRIHGGAIPVIQVGFTTPKTYTPRDVTEIKKNYWAITQEALSHIREHDVIYITGASIGFFMALNLPVDIDFTVATNSVILADELRKYDNVTTYVLGGLMTKKGHLGDHHTLQVIRSMRFDLAFLTAAAFSADFGMSIQSTINVSITQAVIESSRKCIGLFPHEKMGRESILKVCPATDLDLIITDWDTCNTELEKLETLNIKVIIAKEL
ncbi:MAG: DeoR/GlpR transcriptional regulator [Clostridiales bacterium]|nr:DeoR/GlpR transcriptional regulator [Clostridiales bacterium]